MPLEEELIIALDPIAKALGELSSRVNSLPTAEAIGRLHDRIDGLPQPPHAKELAALLVENHADTLRGEAGADADPVAVAEILLEQHGDKLKGQPGQTGADGAGITAEAFQSGAVYRAGAIVTHHIGRYYRALVDTVGTPGESAEWERVGTAGLRARGGFDADIEYEAGDLFVKDYGLFLHDGKKAHLVAGRGIKGEKGQKGDPGTDGKPGAPGADAVGILAVERKGLALAVVLTNGESTVIDFGSSVEEKAQDIFASKAQVEIAYQIKEAVETFTTHPTDSNAIAVRFFRDGWREGVSYEPGDLVSYGDLLYLAIAQSRGEVCQGANAQSFWRFFGNASPAVGSGASGGGGGGGSTDHTQLTGRTENNQHPISAITELENELAKLAPLSSPQFTGVPITPTVPDNTGGGVIASTEYVNTRVANAFAVLAAAYTFDFNKQPAPIVLTETFQTINELTMNRAPGVYLWAVSLTWAYTSTNQAVELRFSADGGSTWNPPWIMEPKDTQDRLPFFYSFPIQHPGGERRVIMQSRKTSPAGTAQVTVSDLWYQRVGMV